MSTPVDSDSNLVLNGAPLAAGATERLAMACDEVIPQPDEWAKRTALKKRGRNWASRGSENFDQSLAAAVYSAPRVNPVHLPACPAQHLCGESFLCELMRLVGEGPPGDASQPAKAGRAEATVAIPEQQAARALLSDRSVGSIETETGSGKRSVFYELVVERCERG